VKLKFRHAFGVLIVLILLPACLRVESQLARITVSANEPGHSVSPMLWGIFFEDINHSADGGIYPELVRNRSFEDSMRAEHWTVVREDGASSEASIDSSHPLNPFNRKSLRIRFEGRACIVNEGYWGMNIVAGERYNLRFAARSEGFSGPVHVLIEASGKETARATLSGITSRWKWFSAELKPESGDPKGKLKIIAEGTGTLWLDMVSLMPERTWKNHGLRTDLCELLDGLKPSFMRFPGGCWVEGDDLAHMYQWKRTVGDIATREPLWNIWQYWATHGLGFHEYLELSEDLGAEPVFCINVGMSHREVVPVDRMSQWVQDALDAIEYANGPTNTVWGSLRAMNGHPAPFGLKYIEIGNENGGPDYNVRWGMFHRAIKSRYPEIQLIANVWGGYPTNPPPDIIDEHYYSNPEFFMQQANRYDAYDRNGPKVFVGEYAVTSGCGQGNLRAAIGEAAFMTGLERNSDIVWMASYAPLFVNVNHKRWNPDLINFDSSRAYGVPSYYVQQMFSLNRGDVTLPLQMDAPEIEPAPRRGRIGLGTWLTRAEFKDIRVVRDGTVLYEHDFAKGDTGWHAVSGNWTVVDGAYRQNSEAENVQAHSGSADWDDYTYTLKARKLGGAEGFLVMFHVRDENNWTWWNLGGWGNREHGIELCTSGGKSQIGRHVPGGIETGRWYDVKVEVKGQNIRCYLDGKLVHDVRYPTIKPLYASATRATSSNEVILKLVNVSDKDIVSSINLAGVKGITTPVRALVLTSASPNDENSLEEPQKVSPRATQFDAGGPDFQWTLPGNSLTVLRTKVRF
jgi:alpha-L-arabinofuranosidase